VSDTIRNHETMGETPVFRGTRVLGDFPAVTKEQAVEVLTEAEASILSAARRS